MSDHDPPVVLVSPGCSDPEGNPYLHLLYAHMPEGFVTKDFTRRGLLQRPDVVHVHWPEFLVRWRAPTRTVVADVVKVLSLLWFARRRGAVLVWTGHDLRPHEVERARLHRLFQRGFLRMVDHVINLADSAGPMLLERYPVLAGRPMTTVRHGHYRDAYPPPPSRQQARRALQITGDEPVLLLLGQLREYKNAPMLIDAVRAHRGLRLVVAGRPHDVHMADKVRERAGDDPSVRLRLEQVSPEDVALLHAAADVVVLPYRAGSALHSGAALLALSFNTPVVMADNGASQELRRLVGQEWVHLHNGTVGEAVRLAVAAAEQGRGALAPLADLEWGSLAAETASVYATTMARRS